MTKLTNHDEWEEIWKATSSKKHTHQFVIPVAFKYEYVGRGSCINEPHPRSKVVTVLRCACGEEINREGTK